MLLNVENLGIAYGPIQVVWDVSLNVIEKEKVALVGSNGAGKTTILKAIVGLLNPLSGKIEFMGERIDRLHAHDVVRRGVVMIPEGRRLFPKMTVLENLEVGAFTSEARAKKSDTIEWIFQQFPILKERKDQLAETLSGGEGQMLAIARGLMARPKLLMLDEPSLGLGPLVVRRIFEVLEELNKQGLTILLVEQYVGKALEFADRGYLLERGRIVSQGTGKELLKNNYIRRIYIG